MQRSPPHVIDADLAFVRVNVLPMTSDVVLPSQTVLVKNGSIVAVAPSAESMPGAGAAIVNGAGRYLMPGLADMHVHIDEERNFLPLVAHGVSFIRNLWGTPQHLEWRAKIESGDVLGPRMITAGAIVDGSTVVWAGSVAVGNPEDVRRVMDEQRAAGYDFFKVYENMALDVFDAVAAHSRATGMRFAGHVPTLIQLKRIHSSRRQSSELLARAEARFMTPLERACAHPDADFRLRMLSDEQLENLQAVFSDSLRQVAALHAAGARLLVGSDVPNPFVLYGYSVHEELGLFVEAGLSPYEALVAATRAPAEFLQDTSFGTVEVGKRADLVLLDANPLVNITANKSIAGVMLRGRWLPQWELMSMLDAMVEGFSTDPVTCPIA